MRRASMRLRAIPVLATVLLVGCSGPPDTRTSSPEAPSASGQEAASPSVAASAVADVVVGGDRPVTVHVPPGYDPARPAPLLIVLHGYGSSGREHEDYFHLQAAAERRGFITAYPDGTKNSNGERFWSATDACCDFERSGVNDVAYLADVVAGIQAKLSVDPKRIDFIGHSNGGFMSYRMACTHPETIAAIVSLAGATFANPADCAPATPVGVLQIHGTADDTIAYTGGTIQGIGPGPGMSSYPGAEQTATTWSTYDMCSGSRSTQPELVDVDADIVNAGQPAESTVDRWAGCRPGGAVELWTIPGGGHGPTLSNAFPDAVLDFFEAHPKP